MKVKNVVNKEKKIKYILFVLFLPVMLNGLNSLLHDFLHFEDTSIVTLLITGTVALYGWFLISKGFKKKSMIIYITLLAAYAVNFGIYSYSRQYMLEQSMLMIYLFYLPISVLIISNDFDWSLFLSQSHLFCAWAAILSTITVFGTSLSANINYMQFSYAVLPFAMINYVLLRRDFKPYLLISFVAICISIIVFGARAPILFLVAFIFYCEIIAFKNRAKHIIVMAILASAIIILYMIFENYVLEWANNIVGTTGSYFIRELLKGDLLVSHGRDVINQETSRALSEMGFHIYGLFGDRYACDIIYSHNIIREIFLSFGWIIGTVLIAVIVTRIVRFFLKNGDDSKYCVFGIIFFGLLCRYFISGSFVNEGRFYLCMGLILAITCGKSNSQKEKGSEIL